MARLASLLSRYATVFSTGDEDVGRTTRIIRQHLYRTGPEKEAEAERQVQDLLKRGLIELAGAWSSTAVLVRKKDRKWHFCIDYRRLNAVTEKDTHDQRQPRRPVRQPLF